LRGSVAPGRARAKGWICELKTYDGRKSKFLDSNEIRASHEIITMLLKRVRNDMKLPRSYRVRRFLRHALCLFWSDRSCISTELPVQGSFRFDVFWQGSTSCSSA